MEQKNNSFDKKEFRQFDEQPVRRHSRFLAVMFGFVPGAGHMYLGKMNRGLTLMALCFGMIALGVIFTPVFLLLPLVWFYAFFDCLNLSALPQAKLDAMPDELGFGSIDLNALKLKMPAGSGGKVLGWAFILVGGYMLYELLAYRVIELLESVFHSYDLWWLRNLVSKFPQIVLSVIIIALGIRLIRGGRKRTDEVPRYQGGGEDSAASIMELIRARAEEEPLNDAEEPLAEENTAEAELPAEEAAEPVSAPAEEA